MAGDANLSGVAYVAVVSGVMNAQSSKALAISVSRRASVIGTFPGVKGARFARGGRVLNWRRPSLNRKRCFAQQRARVLN
jgi:hypothetical protein